MKKSGSKLDSSSFMNETRQKPPPFNVRRFIYNRQEGLILGRSKSGWAKIGIFYTIFYGVLAALVAICMWVFFQTLDPRVPKWRLEKSIIGTNPGLGFRPLPPEENVESTLIWYKGTDYENYKIWTEALTSFLAGGIIINIECKAWARNIIHDRKEKMGSVHFELLID
ncbi:Sodium/potassium-transporting ATPase subunit beta-2 [Pseudolycoriella hygida]|uniref:Sodium/potassium-transporting ATPase subunit beta-2 n=1 Tax=Pseudolycoriella hygida TaxID=35572 RepID=A0A9Q0NG34_9DIPT|nr:Sodium/potassium-transporting ATPase subunit beta-2 [Pseudolycoriella hygida]